jgi:SAM-dependent methyltransferase
VSGNREQAAAGIAAGHFDSLYARDPDPWDAARSWYERRKRAILSAVLPRERFASIYEPGCGNGELSIALAERCDRLVASDFSEEAVRIAHAKTAHLAHVEVRRESLPEQWPALSSGAPAFDLIVFSELGYYFDAAQLAELAALAMASLAPAGYLLACHWKKDFGDRRQATHAMHALLDDQRRLQRRARYEDEDFLLDLWQKA